MSSQQPTFNEAISEIKKILSEIESGEMDIDYLSEQVKRASELIALCKGKIKFAEEETKKILQDEEK